MARSDLSENCKPVADDEMRHNQMVSIPLEKFVKLTKRGRELEAELARYSAKYGLTDEARRLFGIAKS